MVTAVAAAVVAVTTVVVAVVVVVMTVVVVAAVDMTEADMVADVVDMAEIEVDMELTEVVDTSNDSMADEEAPTTVVAGVTADKVDTIRISLLYITSLPDCCVRFLCPILSALISNLTHCLFEARFSSFIADDSSVLLLSSLMLNRL